MKFLVCIKQVGDDGDMNRFDQDAGVMVIAALQVTTGT